MKRNFFFPTLVAMVSLLAISSIGATYAWYQYQTYVSVSLGGTSIDSTKVFQVGLISERTLDAEQYNLSYENLEGKNVYWVNGAITPTLSTYYLSENGYGTRDLQGVTSGKYKNGERNVDGSDAFMLKAAPHYLKNYSQLYPSYYKQAEKNDYMHFDFVFRVNEMRPSGQTTLSNSKVRLANVEFKNGWTDLEKSMRIHFSSNGDGFVFNPGSVENGVTTTGGTLDMYNDGVYDWFESADGRYEYIYGEYEKLVYKTEKTSDGVDMPSGYGNGNCFDGDHLNGVYAVDDEKTIWSSSEYLGTRSVITNNKVLAEAGDNGLAFFSMDIYLEGWDYSFIDHVMGSAFGCELEFESL